uniref:Uncharacterized protein n=1 Tax=Arundo donax TaxID=35708 RepID=A0A0A9B0N6_ARUDO
MPPFLLGVNFC